MEHGFLVRIIDRVVANARVIRGAPETVALTGVITLGVSYFGFQHFHQERLAVLNDRIASQERVLAEYRTKLKGAEEAATQIENLTRSLAETQESLREAKSKPISVEKQSRDPRRLYEGNIPIALAQDPKVDLEKKKITFPIVSAAVILGTNKVYEFPTGNWRAAALKCTTWSMMMQHESSLTPL
jgi:hypothetical protein